MKGILLAGGSGTRLRPVTRILNKHLLLVGRYPMIVHGLYKLRQAGIREICIVTGHQSAGLFADLLGSGAEWGVRLHYRIQDEPGGIAQALSCAETFIQPGESLVVMLGDNLFEDDLSAYVNEYRKRKKEAMVLLKEVPDPERFGVPVIEDGEIRRIVEKPVKPPCGLAVAAIYFYSSSVFEQIREVHPSERGELEITDVNNRFAALGQLAYSTLNGWWIDAGTFDSLAEASNKLQRLDLLYS